VSALIARSLVEPAPGVRRYLAFMPHGENVILVLEDDVPRRVLVKDLAEEIVLMNTETRVPPEVDRIRDPTPVRSSALCHVLASHGD
jgi:siderophore synthetase component